MPAGPLYLVLLGAPGCGKGSQADKLQASYSTYHISTGDLLREILAQPNPTPFQLKVKEIVSSGSLVADDLVFQILREHLESHPQALKSGFSLDGYPRTIRQAELLDSWLQEHEKICLSKVLLLAVDEELLVQRIVGRLVHPGSGRTYHEQFHPPIKPMCDDVTGEPLIRRLDDSAATLRSRLLAYHSQTEPLIAYYQRKNLLCIIDASASPDQVFGKIKNALTEAHH